MNKQYLCKELAEEAIKSDPLKWNSSDLYCPLFKGKCKGLHCMAWHDAWVRPKSAKQQEPDASFKYVDVYEPIKGFCQSPLITGEVILDG